MLRKTFKILLSSLSLPDLMEAVKTQLTPSLIRGFRRVKELLDQSSPSTASVEPFVQLESEDVRGLSSTAEFREEVEALVEKVRDYINPLESHQPRPSLQPAIDTFFNFFGKKGSLSTSCVFK